MRLHHIKGAEEKVESSEFVIQDGICHKGKWRREVFENGNPIHLEIGCGKGQFLFEMAKRNPEINYLGIERMSSVLIRAIEKLEEQETPFPNLRFLCVNAENLPFLFDKAEIEKIYLNFSDPWPKDRHHKRRLTSREFLKRYEAILPDDGIIEQKTDNEGLYQFTLTETKEEGWEILYQTTDLHKSEQAAENVMTEYEERFAILGKKIFKLIMRKKH